MHCGFCLMGVKKVSGLASSILPHRRQKCSTSANMHGPVQQLHLCPIILSMRLLCMVTQGSQALASQAQQPSLRPGVALSWSQTMGVDITRKMMLTTFKHPHRSSVRWKHRPSVQIHKFKQEHQTGKSQTLAHVTHL